MKIYKLLGRDLPLSGSVGLEIEVEGVSLPKVQDKIWRTEGDGSLKTDEAYEYVLKKPVSYTQIAKAIDQLGNKLSDSTIFESERAGVHVHINVQHDTVASLGTFICTYYMFETVLLNFCGQKRAGNLFCLRLQDADAPIDYLLRALKGDRFDVGSLHTDKLRYASLNLKALPTYGSLEFRGMRSTGDFKQLKIWVAMLLKLRSFSRRIDDPSKLLEAYQYMNDEVLVKSIFGKYSHHILNQSTYKKDIAKDLMRIIQLLMSKKWKK